MRVAVIGGAGRMGAWFVRYFSSRGFSTILSDVRTEEARKISDATGAELAKTNADAVKDADLALVCVPIADTPGTILKIAAHMRLGAILAEVSSVKIQVFEALQEAASMGIQPLSIHPLFGPAAESPKGKTIAIIPVVNGDVEAGLAEHLFEGARIEVSDPEEHDRAMAVVLSLTHFMNLAFSQVLSSVDLLSAKRLSGTTFTVQLAIAESVVDEDPSLVTQIIKENRFSDMIIDLFLSGAAKIREFVEMDVGGLVELHNSLKTSFERDPDYSKANEKRYRAFEALRS